MDEMLFPTKAKAKPEAPGELDMFAGPGVSQLENEIRALRIEQAKLVKANAELQRENDELRGVIETFGRVTSHQEIDRAVTIFQWEVHEVVLRAASSPDALFGAAWRGAMDEFSRLRAKLAAGAGA